VAAGLVAGAEALASSRVVGVATGQDGVIREANDEMLRILGLDREQLSAGISWVACTPADQIERDARGLQDVASQGGAVVAKEFIRPDGTRVPVLAVVAAVEQTPYRWVAVVADLSGRDRKLGRDSDAAIVSALLEEAPVGFALIDADLRFVRVNRELAAMNGHAVAELEGRRVFDVVPGAQADAEPMLRKVLDSGEPVRDVAVRGWTAARPDALGTWLETFFPVRGREGPMLGVAVIARDVTQLTELRDQLQSTVHRQRAALIDLQTSLLPVVPELENAQVCARYLGASTTIDLGGDWYDVITAPDGRLALCVGDVTGHGLAAVGAMARVSGAMHAYVCDGYGPADVLERVNRLVADRSSPGLATAALAFLDMSTGVVELASAGHAPPLLRSADGSVSVLAAARGLLLGARANSSYEAQHAVVAPGGALLLYTDGLVERRGETLDEGTARLTSALASAPGPAGIDAMVDHVLKMCLAGDPRSDDVCALAALRTAG